MQAPSCSREGEYCRLIRLSVIIVGYVRFRLKLNLEAILESKASFLRKICSGHQNERIASGLCRPKFVKKLDCRLFISCNILIRPVTHVARKFVFWASFTISLKLQIHPRQVPRLWAANILLPRRTKPAQHSKFVRVNSRATKSLSIKGFTSATKGKSRKSLSFSLL